MNATTPARAEVLRARDFIGWTVSDSRGEKLGTVDDLLLDRACNLRFVAVNPGMFRKRVLLPATALAWGEGTLVTSNWTAEQLKALPPYDPAQPLTREALDELRSAFPRLYQPGLAAEPPVVSTDAQIVPLREAKEFRLASGTPDLTGWNVFASDGERAGTVASMLVDPVAMKVRYLAVDLADDLFQLGDDRVVVVPAERVDLRERGRDVWVEGLRARDLARLPAYTGGALDPLVAQRVDEAFAQAAPSTPAGIHSGEPTQAPARDAAPDPAHAAGTAAHTGPAHDAAARDPAPADDSSLTRVEPERQRGAGESHAEGSAPPHAPEEERAES